MPIASNVRPTIDRDDVAVALVEEVITDEQTHQEAITAIIKHWETAPWPAGLVAQSLFVGTDGGSLLTYAQWRDHDALAVAMRGPGGAQRFDWRGVGVASGEPRAYELYRRVQPAVLPDPVPPVGCYPAAYFVMDSADAARKWIDGLLNSEEETEGKDRAYPGALAANFHVASDGSGIFLLSEWASEAEAVAHIDEVIIPLLEYMGQAQAGPGRRYAFLASAAA
ncbi:hypothetical protein O7632_17375 [Solwaraspora sp. WMMD406]|uniref:hypothetical protein n=1 Tax=Solwaraspora sp. WMMD406 TaxID=3016095 RepID=UPI0024163F46|nr:hypothetical protein [Solwaraspora sp. WMMD406]MDG4765858.1 hypothetical protein [Solwaraspora sp. WMMD406]